MHSGKTWVARLNTGPSYGAPERGSPSYSCQDFPGCHHFKVTAISLPISLRKENKVIILFICNKLQGANKGKPAAGKPGNLSKSVSSLPPDAINGHPGSRKQDHYGDYLHSMGEADREPMAIFERATQKSHTDFHTRRRTAVGGSAQLVVV